MSSLVPSKRLRPRTDLRRIGARLGLLLSTLALGIGPSASGAALAETAPEAAPARAEQKSSRTEDSLAVKGIYLQQLTVEDASRLRELLDKARMVDINTVVVDLWRRSPEYVKAIETIQDAGLRYVPRITMFPDGARRDQIDDRALLERRWRLIDYALKLGAKDVQLDYIRGGQEPSRGRE